MNIFLVNGKDKKGFLLQILFWCCVLFLTSVPRALERCLERQGHLHDYVVECRSSGGLFDNTDSALKTESIK